MINKLIEWLIKNNWTVKLADKKNTEDITMLKQQFEFLDLQYLDFIQVVEECVNHDETIWFNCSKELLGKADIEFKWNEFEIISLESAANDEEWMLEIESFWKKHVPIILSVSDGYSYYALRDDGRVVVGNEPEFEETEIIADSFSEFISKIIESKIQL